MPRTYIIKEIDLKTYEHTHLHFVNVPSVVEQGFYRQVMSLNAFAWGKHQYNRSKTTLYFVLREDEYEIDLRSMLRTFPDYLETLKQSKHESLWAFYEAIGYDYKKKKHYDKT